MTTTFQHPKARTEEILAETLESGEVVVYDRGSDHAHCLNPTAATVWGLCDGDRSVGEIARLVGERCGATADDATAMTAVALEELAAAGLLAEQTWAPPAVGLDRRQLLARVGAGAVAATVVPAVMSILAPTPAAAATCLAPGTVLQSGQSFLDCCSQATRQEGGNTICL